MNVHKKRLLSKLQAALPELSAEAQRRAEEFEKSRMIALDFTSKLKQAGTYRILVSEEQGGLGGSLTDWYDMVRTLAYADASTGWTAAHGAVTGALIANTAAPEFVEHFFANPDASAAWSNLPRIKTTEVDGGLQITGRWGFGTGCTAATYVGGMIPLEDKLSESGFRFVVALAPLEEATIDYTWDPVGLAGTGSHDIVFESVFVPWERIFDWPDSKANYDYPTAIFVPGTWFISICAAATHLGLARRAIDDARSELEGKLERSTQQPLLSKAEYLRPLEEAEGLHYACSAGLEKALSEVWGCGLGGKPLSQEQRLCVRLSAVTAVHQCEAIVRSVYDIAGASAIRKTSALQRLYRDASCLTHHVSANLNSFNLTGRTRAGIDPLSFMI